MMIWQVRPGTHPDMLGFIPSMISEDDERPAAEQFNSNYAHGGGWRPMDKWKLDPDGCAITYPGGDPPLKPLALAVLRDELILVYPYAWVAIVGKTGSFQVARLD
jgi:hypothetical protein